MSTFGREKDKVSSLFWLILSAFILKESWDLPFGTLSQPRPGLFPFILGVILGLLSLVLLARCWLGKKKDEQAFFSELGGWKRIGLTFGAMVGFYLIFESAGFILSTFFMTLVLIRFIEPNRWFYSLGAAALISISSYVLFQLLLRSNLPMGFLAEIGF